VSGRLRGIFIECSFDDSHAVDRLYGHLSPKFLIEELKALADLVESHRESKNKENEGKKRKRLSNGNHPEERSPRRPNRASVSQTSPTSPHTQHLSDFMDAQISQIDGNSSSHEPDGFTDTIPIRQKHESPLKGVEIVIIHVKDKLVDGPEQGDIILKELEAYEEDAKLGCKFIISRSGQSVYL
jgi:hypothetical protein